MNKTVHSMHWYEVTTLSGFENINFVSVTEWAISQKFLSIQIFFKATLLFTLNFFPNLLEHSIEMQKNDSGLRDK